MSKTKKMMAGVLTTALMTSLVACGSTDQARPAKPKDKSCDKWKWDENTQTYYCSDSSSSHSGSYYHGGRYYGSKKQLTSSSAYKSFKSSSSYKSGIGSGSKGGFGG
ncbi:hypothetical protein SAMN04487776_103297 [Priestia megaterium]|jgi:uncharacterized lipoprotein YehR (DUF1307 family)|uniref:hypothetical protein n=1 Tax=Priestia megaterium TaxID=1404 RepID=UPI0008EF1F3C|nr:hypothetical protein [Priestia megaterium]MDM8150372.1 hypothetical protein [Priestia megaterium]SFG76411.1 hypothetical protein SAMN04487776_103297 [Priestia megaterium]